MAYEVRIMRVYDSVEEGDGVRILVDRLWPRGVSKERAALTQWDKEIAPSPQLRTWYGHKPELFPQFFALYTEELDKSHHALQFVENCKEWLKRENVTLVYAAKDKEHSHAVVLRKWLQEALCI